jgi:hypothetical protein
LTNFSTAPRWVMARGLKRTIYKCVTNVSGIPLNMKP